VSNAERLMGSPDLNRQPLLEPRLAATLLHPTSLAPFDRRFEHLSVVPKTES
jgi:hypothetical protein